MWYKLLMPYSIDFRKKVLAYCERTGSITEASHLFQISRNIILTEIDAEFGCHPTTIHYALKAMGYTRKKRITPTMNKTQKK